MQKSRNKGFPLTFGLKFPIFFRFVSRTGAESKLGKFGGQQLYVPLCAVVQVVLVSLGWDIVKLQTNIRMLVVDWDEGGFVGDGN
jgi:hypothetical protein